MVNITVLPSVHPTLTFLPAPSPVFSKHQNTSRPNSTRAELYRQFRVSSPFRTHSLSPPSLHSAFIFLAVLRPVSAKHPTPRVIIVTRGNFMSSLEFQSLASLAILPGFIFHVAPRLVFAKLLNTSSPQSTLAKLNRYFGIRSLPPRAHLPSLASTSSLGSATAPLRLNI